MARLLGKKLKYFFFINYLAIFVVVKKRKTIKNKTDLFWPNCSWLCLMHCCCCCCHLWHIDIETTMLFGKWMMLVFYKFYSRLWSTLKLLLFNIFFSIGFKGEQLLLLLLLYCLVSMWHAEMLLNFSRWSWVVLKSIKKYFMFIIMPMYSYVMAIERNIREKMEKNII